MTTIDSRILAHMPDNGPSLQGAIAAPHQKLVAAHALAFAHHYLQEGEVDPYSAYETFDERLDDDDDLVAIYEAAPLSTQVWWGQYADELGIVLDSDESRALIVAEDIQSAASDAVRGAVEAVTGADPCGWPENDTLTF